MKVALHDPTSSKTQAGQRNRNFSCNRMSRLTDEGNTLSLEFSKAFDLVLMKSLRIMWENVKAGEDGGRTWCDDVSFQRHK